MLLDICITSDNNYAQHLAVTIASILKNSHADTELCFYILDGGINEENKNKISKLKNIKDFNIKYFLMNEESFSDVSIDKKYLNITTYFRIKIASTLSELDKVLYLDSDTVINTDLTELISENIEDYYMAGVEDIGYYYDYTRDNDSLYVNAGVVLLNLKKWRDENIEQKLFAYLDENKKTERVKYLDQDALNAVLKGKIKQLDFKWNVQDSFFRKNERENHPEKTKINSAVKNPSIIHFTNVAKPWNNYNLPAAELYIKYICLTQFKKDSHSLLHLMQKRARTLAKKLLKNPMFFLNDRMNILPISLSYKLILDFNLMNNNPIEENYNMNNFKYKKFLEVLNENGFQEKLNGLKKRYKNKKIIIYGTGLICDIIFENFNFQNMNIIAVSDKKYKDETETYKNIPAIPPEKIAEKKPDIVLTTLQDFFIAADYFEDELFKTTKKFKYRSIFIYSIGEFLSAILKNKLKRI